MAALSMADHAVPGNDARIFKCWNVSPVLGDHEFVITPYGNLRSRGGETHRRGAEKAPPNSEALAAPDPNLIA